LGESIEAAAARAQIIEVRLRKRHPFALLVQLAQLDDALLARVRQRAQQDRIKHAEDRGRCANP
jgi:hypothetical protein